MRRAAEASARLGRGRVRIGIGDDCAVLRVPPGHELLVTTDFSLEGVHFRHDWHSAEIIGHRCLARGLSDLAAMGGEPLAAFLSLALPPKMPQAWVDGFLRGLLRLARQFKITLAGGDTASSPSGVLVDIVVLGSVPKGRAVLRSGARVGDRIYVTGSLGGAAAALRLLESGKKIAPTSFPTHFFPTPRIQAGQALRRNRLASAMIDLSDGLSTDLVHICEESGVGAEIREQAVPRAKGGGTKRAVAIEDALHGGEDYELLFTARPKTRVPRTVGGVPIACIGEIVRGKKISLLRLDGRRTALEPRGWEHFRSPRPHPPAA